MGEFSLQQILPMFPWEGPPLPRFLQVFWPWVSGEGPKLPSLQLPPFLMHRSAASSDVLYQNAEEMEVVRDESGAIAKVIRHIKVTKQAEG